MTQSSDLTILGYTLKQTCVAPIWYDIHRGDAEVGFIRMGQGYLFCYQGLENDIIYRIDHGVNLEDEEQCDCLLIAAVNALDAELRKPLP